MHEVDRSIHPPVSQSKAIDERAQPGRIENKGERGEEKERINGWKNELTKPKNAKASRVEYAIGEVSSREQREIRRVRHNWTVVYI